MATIGKNRENALILAIVGVLLIVVTLGLREIANQSPSFADYEAGNPGENVTIVVEDGASGEMIARNLYENGVIASWQSFFQLAIEDSRATRIAPGSYRIDTRISALEALEQLLDKDRILGLISLRDGVRLSEVRAILGELGYQGIDEALKSITLPLGIKGASVEGFLYPARYSFEPGTSTIAVMNAMVRRFEAAVADLDLTRNVADLSAKDLITVASLVEAEGTPDVFAKIARVIYNRLRIGMPLQLDATIHYLQERRGEISLSLNETKIQSAYNTYLNRGLPPGPIGSPTRAAIIASLEPADGDWLYFITVAPGDTRFTRSYEEFLELKRLYRENYRSGLFDD